MRGFLDRWGLPVFFFLIWFQQAPVLKAGGSFKLYELAALLLLLWWLVFDARKKIHGPSSFAFFLMFVAVGGMGLLLHLSDLGGVLPYYARFPEAVGILRFDALRGPLIVYGYYLFIWCVFNQIAGSREIGFEPKRAVRFFQAGGVVVCLYVFYGVVLVARFHWPDLVPGFLDGRNRRPTELGSQPAGFSSEPGTLVFLISWAVLLTWFLKDAVGRTLRWVLLPLFISVLLLTRSTALLGLAFGLVAYFLLFASWRVRIQTLGVAAFLGFILFHLDRWNLQWYYVVYQHFFEKVVHFLSASSQTIDSGGMRHYTSSLGLEVFKEFPWFGSGPGASFLHLHAHEMKMGILQWGERLIYSSPVQNCHYMVLAEGGVLGYGAFLGGFAAYFWEIHPLRLRHRGWHAVAFIGGLSSFFMLFSVFPTHSLFLWLGLALCLAVARHGGQAALPRGRGRDLLDLLAGLRGNVRVWLGAWAVLFALIQGMTHLVFPRFFADRIDTFSIPIAMVSPNGLRDRIAADYAARVVRLDPGLRWDWAWTTGNEFRGVLSWRGKARPVAEAHAFAARAQGLLRDVTVVALLEEALPAAPPDWAGPFLERPILGGAPKAGDSEAAGPPFPPGAGLWVDLAGALEHLPPAKWPLLSNRLPVSQRKELLGVLARGSGYLSEPLYQAGPARYWTVSSAPMARRPALPVAFVTCFIALGFALVWGKLRATGAKRLLKISGPPNEGANPP
ncbi:MAG: O-antigen ligase family protein [Spirochaetes bacterium]|nr:O-antigen ligase family protein [Spirochaetota bacterium]